MVTFDPAASAEDCPASPNPTSSSTVIVQGSSFLNELAMLQELKTELLLLAVV